MLYECTKDYEGEFNGIKGHIYALSEDSAKKLKIEEISNFKLLTEDEEKTYINDQSKQ